MAKLWEPLNGAWEVLTFRVTVALLVMLAESGATAQSTRIAFLVVLARRGSVELPTLLALRVVLAERGAAARLTDIASLVVLAESGGVALPTVLAQFVVLAKSRAATHPTLSASLPMCTFLLNAPLHRVWRWRHFYNCRSFHATNCTLARGPSCAQLSYVSNKECFVRCALRECAVNERRHVCHQRCTSVAVVNHAACLQSLQCT